MEVSRIIGKFDRVEILSLIDSSVRPEQIRIIIWPMTRVIVCMRVSLEKLSSLSPRDIVQLHIEYFISAWWTDRKNQCVEIVRQLASRCQDPDVLAVATSQAKYLVTQTDYIKYVIKDKPRLVIRQDKVTLADYEKHIVDHHHVFIYGEYPFSSASFYTSNPVIRPASLEY